MNLENEMLGVVVEIRGRMQECGIREKCTTLISDADRNRLICKRFGFDGNGATAERALADEFGLAGTPKGSMARVSEIVKPFKEFMTGTRCRSMGDIATPLLDKTLAILGDTAPAPLDEVKAKLVEGGITRKFSIVGVFSAAEMLGRRIPFCTVTEGSTGFLLPIKRPGLVHEITEVAAASTQHMGIIDIRQVVATVFDMETHQNGLGTTKEESFVRSVLEARPDLQWIDREAGVCFLIDVEENLLLRQVNKVLSVASWVDIPTLRDAVERYNWKHEVPKKAQKFGFTKFSAPQNDILLEFCRKCGFQVVGDAVIAPASLRPEDTLLRPEMKIYRLLRDNGGAMAQQELEDAYRQTGRNPDTLATYLSTSPICIRSSDKIVRLVGGTGAFNFPVNDSGQEEVG